mgnify:CR=1 FL=1
MFYYLGKHSCYEIAELLFTPFLAQSTGLEEASLGSWCLAYSRYLKFILPEIPEQPQPGVVLVDDIETESSLISAFYNPSPLDDLEYYKNSKYFECVSGAELFHELDYLSKVLHKIQHYDPDFWQAFSLFITFILCPSSEFSAGGTDSAAIGTIFLSKPSQYDERDLYELLVHEFTHTVMFLDERISPHYNYVNEHLLAYEENYAIASISRKKRPLDKVIHSMVVSAEILLHREIIVGHDLENRKIHPTSPDLKDGIIATIDSLQSLKNREKLLTQRSLWLMNRCYQVATSV